MGVHPLIIGTKQSNHLLLHYELNRPFNPCSGLSSSPLTYLGTAMK